MKREPNRRRSRPVVAFVPRLHELFGLAVRRSCVAVRGGPQCAIPLPPGSSEHVPGAAKSATRPRNPFVSKGFRLRTGRRHGDCNCTMSALFRAGHPDGDPNSAGPSWSIAPSIVLLVVTERRPRRVSGTLSVDAAPFPPQFHPSAGPLAGGLRVQTLSSREPNRPLGPIGAEDDSRLHSVPSSQSPR
ncbi:MAG: hypothetical protein ACI8QZ_001810 [Chlamydiales bacterium]|jgi:hypothetical protein